MAIGSLVSARLAELETIIERGLATFVEVGRALLEIQTEKLYKDTHTSFEAYCHARWGWSRQRSFQLMDAYKVSTMVDTPNERVARELVPLADEPKELSEAMAEARKRHGREPTAAEVREIVRSRMGVHYSSETDEWSTPADLFNVLNQEFQFDVDVCATAANAKALRFYSREEDGLAQQWVGSCWMNPPYGDEIAAWVGKAWAASEAGTTVVCLVPARVDTRWWWDYCRYGEIRFLRGRLRFGGSESGAPFPSAVVIFPRKPTVVWWEWQTV